MEEGLPAHRIQQYKPSPSRHPSSYDDKPTTLDLARDYAEEYVVNQVDEAVAAGQENAVPLMANTRAETVPYIGRRRRVHSPDAGSIYRILNKEHPDDVLAPLLRDTHPAVVRARKILQRIRAATPTATKWQKCQCFVATELAEDCVVDPSGSIYLKQSILGETADESKVAAAIAHAYAPILGGYQFERDLQKEQLSLIGPLVALLSLAPALVWPVPCVALPIITSLGFYIRWQYILGRIKRETDRLSMIVMARARMDPEAAYHYWGRKRAMREYLPAARGIFEGKSSTKTFPDQW